MVLNYDDIAMFLYQLFDLDKVTISIDRTNWKWGKKNINIFMLSVVHKGIAIPLYWELLDKRGNSNSKERMNLVQRFIGTFGKDKISYILADREFVGKDWFGWLNHLHITFCIRIKKNSLVTNRFGQLVQVHTLFREVKPYQCLVLSRIVKVDGCYVRLSARRNGGNELMIVATNDIRQYDGVALYKKRWEIETLFSCFKSRGFNLEDTHLTNQDKMKKLVAVFAIAFCWCYKIGIKQNQEKPIKRKNHGRLSKSLFRLGLDVFQETMRKVVIFFETNTFDDLLRHLVDI